MTTVRNTNPPRAGLMRQMWLLASGKLCWLPLYRTCPYLSAWVNAMLDRGEVPKRVNKFEIQLAGRKLWAGNYPYAYATNREVMPDRATVFRLHEATAAAEWAIDGEAK